jgi:hypothetical protein
VVTFTLFPANGNDTARSNYNALQLQFQRRLSRGLQALASYTWSHSIDDGSAGSALLGSNTFVPALGANANKGPSDFEYLRMPASFVLLPNERFDHGFLHDWRLLLPDSKCFSLHTIFEDSVAGCLAVVVRDDHSEIVVLGFLLICRWGHRA